MDEELELLELEARAREREKLAQSKSNTGGIMDTAANYGKSLVKGITGLGSVAEMATNPVGFLFDPNSPAKRAENTRQQYLGDPNYQTTAGHILGKAVEYAPSMALGGPEMLSVKGAASAIGSAIGGGLAEEYFPKSALAEGVMGGVGGLIPGVVSAGRAVMQAGRTRAAGAANQSAWLQDEAAQAALRYAKNRGWLESTTAKEALATGKVTPEIEQAVKSAQAEAIGSKASAPQFEAARSADYLPGIAGGYPESSSANRPFAASETVGQVGDDLIKSGLYEGGERINPYTGTFDGPPSAPTDAFALEAKAVQASADTIAARKNTVAALDLALQEINRQSPGMPKVRGIMFDVDLEPMLGELRQTIAKRDMLVQTKPMSAEMKRSYDMVQQSFDSIQNSSVMSRWNKIGPDGTRQVGELTPSEMLSLIEDMNAYRRALAEFDEATKAAGLNSTFSDVTGRGAELYALSEVQAAAQKALEGKASEILANASSVRGYFPWQEALAPVTPTTLPTMNKTYGAMQEAASMAKTYQNTTHRGMVTPEPGRLITTQKQTQESLGDKFVEASRSPLLSSLSYAIDKVTGKPVPVNNTPLETARRNLQRPAAMVSQVLDGLLLRQKAIPVLSRDWEKVKRFPAAMTELENRAVAFGMLAPGMLASMPEPLQKDLHSQLAQMDPQGFEAVPGNYNVTNGQYLNSLEKDANIKNALPKSPAERAMVIGSAFENRFVAPPTAPTTAQARPQPSRPISDYASALGSVLPSPTASSEGGGVIDDLMRHRGQINVERSGL